MTNQQPHQSDEEHRVLEFRPRAHPRAPVRAGGMAGPAPAKDPRPEPNDLSRYERDRGEPDDFRHRMLANLAAFAFTVALTAVAMWLVISIADLRKTQDCMLMGRRDCARVAAPLF